jgi:hypothetical protein
MDTILKEILFLLRNEDCPYKSVKIKLMNLIHILSMDNPDHVQQAQIESLTSFPTAIEELINLIIDAINKSKCAPNEKTDLLSLLNNFVELKNSDRK